jgi:hypothetical protein
MRAQPKSDKYKNHAQLVNLMTIINPTEWTTFIDKGIVTDTRVCLIANKIKANKPLTKQEVSMYQEASQRIESQLKSPNQ